MNELILFSYFISLSILLIYGLHGFHMVYLYKKFKKNEPKHDPNFKPSKRVTIQLPLYNEVYVVERLINAICSLDYPKELIDIQVLDDSTDETVEVAKKIVEQKRLEGFDITHVRRGSREGFKAGALKYGLNFAKGEFIAIFDADFVPPPDFLKKTLSYFSDEKIGLVQTRWGHINDDYSLLTKTQAFALDGHFVIEQYARHLGGYFITFNGTGGVWRKECIIDAGNWNGDTLAEDLDLSYRAQLKGWKFVYLKDYITPAELPIEMSDFKSQQFRWTKGHIENAKKLLPLLWKSKLPFSVKFQGTIHLTSNFVFPFILLAAILNVPLIFIKNSGPYDIFFNYMAIFIVSFFSTFLFYFYAQKEGYSDWRKRIVLFPLFLAGSMGMALNNSRAVIEAVLNRKSEFVRTPKYKVTNSNSDSFRSIVYNKYLNKKIDSTAMVEMILALYCFIGVLASLYFMELAALPFQLLFFSGFLMVSYFSIKNSFLKKR